MNPWQVVSGLFLVFLLICLLYIAFRVASYQIDKRLPRPVVPVPAPALVSPTQPSIEWWEALQALKVHVDTQVSQFQSFAVAGEQAYRNARSSEERARKRERRLEAEEDDDDGLPAAQLGVAPVGWENASAPAEQPVTPAMNHRISPQKLALLEQRRGRA